MAASGWWLADMNKRIAIIASVLGLIGAFGTALAVVDDLRFWATRSEMLTVADAAFAADMRGLQQRLLEIQILIQKCSADPTCKNGPDMKSLRGLESEIEKQIRQREEQEKGLH